MVTGKAPEIGEVKEVPMRNRRTGRVATKRIQREGRT